MIVKSFFLFFFVVIIVSCSSDDSQEESQKESTAANPDSAVDPNSQSETELNTDIDATAELEEGEYAILSDKSGYTAPLSADPIQICKTSGMPLGTLVKAPESYGVADQLFLCLGKATGLEEGKDGPFIQYAILEAEEQLRTGGTACNFALEGFYSGIFSGLPSKEEYEKYKTLSTPILLGIRIAVKDNTVCYSRIAGPERMNSPFQGAEDVPQEERIITVEPSESFPCQVKFSKKDLPNAQISCEGQDSVQIKLQKFSCATPEVCQFSE